MQDIGTIGIVARRIPRVEIDAAQIHDPEQRRQVLDHRKIDDAARSMFDGARLDPVRPWVWSAFHEEALLRDPVRIALHDHRPIVKVREQHRCDRHVVAQQVGLGATFARPEHLVEVGESERTPIEIEIGVAAIRDLCVRRTPGHYRTRASLGGRRPRRTAPATGTYASSRSARALRNSTPPRLMSPRPTNVSGNSSRLPNTVRSGSTYLPVAMLPSSTISAASSNPARMRSASRTSGARKRSPPAERSTCAKLSRSWRVTRVSGDNRPREVVMMWTAATPADPRPNICA